MKELLAWVFLAAVVVVVWPIIFTVRLFQIVSESIKNSVSARWPVDNVREN